MILKDTTLSMTRADTAGNGGASKRTSMSGVRRSFDTSAARARCLLLRPALTEAGFSL